MTKQNTEIQLHICMETGYCCRMVNIYIKFNLKAAAISRKEEKQTKQTQEDEVLIAIRFSTSLSLRVYLRLQHIIIYVNVAVATTDVLQQQWQKTKYDATAKQATALRTTVNKINWQSGSKG